MLVIMVGWEELRDHHLRVFFLGPNIQSRSHQHLSKLLQFSGWFNLQRQARLPFAHLTRLFGYFPQSSIGAVKGAEGGFAHIFVGVLDQRQQFLDRLLEER